MSDCSSNDIDTRNGGRNLTGRRTCIRIAVSAITRVHIITRVITHLSCSPVWSVKFRGIFWILRISYVKISIIYHTLFAHTPPGSTHIKPHTPHCHHTATTHLFKPDLAGEVIPPGQSPAPVPRVPGPNLHVMINRPMCVRTSDREKPRPQLLKQQRL